MPSRFPPLVRCITLGLVAALPAAGQSGIPEIDELHRRVAVVRAELPQITALAEKYTTFLGREATGRFLIPRAIDPSFYLEFYGRAGGPPDTQDADASDTPGLALLAVRHWVGNGFGVAARVEQLRSQGRPVLILGPANGRPEALLNGATVVDNGAPDGDRASAPINGIANLIVGWTFYTEVAAAATRAGWQPGVLLSVLVPGASSHNAGARFRMSGPDRPDPIPGGQLARQFLDAIDSILGLAGAPAHRTLLDTVAARLRSLRQSGRTIYAGSCGHYLLEEIPRDAMTSAIFSVLPGAGASSTPVFRTPSRDDVMVWFGYGGYDCPNADVSGRFQDLGLQVVVASDRLPPTPAPNVLAGIRLPWQLPDGVVALPFAPGRMAPLSSIDMATHYLWLRRLLAEP